jgi:thiol-disulfide isomerase/thioredoxin
MFKKVMIFVLVILISSSFAIAENDLTVGDIAPTFYLKDINGNDFFLRNFCGEKLRRPWKNKKKHIIVLSFWATWCAPCQKEVPILQNVALNYKDKNVKVLLVNVGEEANKVKKFIKEHHYQLPVLMDGFKVVSEKKYGVKTLPKLFVIDPNGLIQQINKGFKKADTFQKELSATLDKLLSNN